MGLRVWKQKVLFVLHLRSLDDETLAAQIYKEQKTQYWPGLIQETKQICKELDLEDCNITRLSKTDYKTLLMKACHLKNEARLRLQASETKCARMRTEPYGKQDYINSTTIEQARGLFRTRFGLQDFAGNYSHNRKFAKSDWLCRCKTAKEEECHII